MPKLKGSPVPRLTTPARAPLPGGERVVRPKVVPLPDFGVVLFESRHGPGFVGELRDDFSKFLLILGGQAKWEARGKQIAVATDSLVHVPVGLLHHQYDSPTNPVMQYVIHYRPTVLPELLSNELFEQGLMHWNLSLHTPLLARAVRSEFQEMLFEQGAQRAGWEWMLCSLLVELAVRMLRVTPHGAGQTPAALFFKGLGSAERVAQYALELQSRFYLRETLDEAAAATSLSRRQFCDVFRKVTGQSWKHHVQSLRLEHSRKLLLETGTTVTAAAFESGFEDLSAFNHAFKKAFGCSPQAARQQAGWSGKPLERQVPPPQPEGPARSYK